MSKLIDFRTTSWGHNMSLENKGDGVFSGFVWCTPGPRVGDYLTWKTNYGEAVAEVIESEWTVNVEDMFKIKVEVIHRIEKKWQS